jgi:hypothetical protein
MKETKKSTTQGIYIHEINRKHILKVKPKGESLSKFIVKTVVEATGGEFYNPQS